MARRGYDEEDEEVAPWLAAADVEPEARHTHVPKSRLIWWLGLLAVLLVLAVGLIYALIAKPDDDGEFTGEDGQPALISAPDGPYKVRPKSAGGMDVEGVGQTAYEAADGVDPGGDLDLNAAPEEPMARPTAAAPIAAAPVAAPPAEDVEAGDAAIVHTAPAAPKAATPAPVKAAPVTAPAKPAPVAAKPVAPKPAPKTDRLAGLEKELTAEAKAKPAAVAPVVPPSSGTGTVLQLGAFSSEAKAKAAWKNFTGRYGYLSGLEQAIAPLERDGKTLYRLRATGAASHGQAVDLCARLKVAGEQCSVTE